MYDEHDDAVLYESVCTGSKKNTINAIAADLGCEASWWVRPEMKNVLSQSRK